MNILDDLVKDILKLTSEEDGNFVFEIYPEEGGFRSNLGDWIDRQRRLPEWKTSFIAYDKYRRKLNLDNTHLTAIRSHLKTFIRKRELEGKTTSDGLLTQEAVRFIREDIKHGKGES